jgi:hypothetical protein
MSYNYDYRLGHVLSCSPRSESQANDEKLSPSPPNGPDVMAILEAVRHKEAKCVRATMDCHQDVLSALITSHLSERISRGRESHETMTNGKSPSLTHVKEIFEARPRNDERLMITGVVSEPGKASQSLHGSSTSSLDNASSAVDSDSDTDLDEDDASESGFSSSFEGGIEAMTETQWLDTLKSSLTARYLDDVVTHANHLLNDILQDLVINCQDLNGANGSPNTNSTSAASSSSATPRSSSKRPRISWSHPTGSSSSWRDKNNGGDDGGDDDDRRGRRRKQPIDKGRFRFGSSVGSEHMLIVRADSISGLRFACPFYKRVPALYQDRACRGPGWPNTHRLKEHIYRCHKQPVHCPRCKATYSTDGQLGAHLMEDERCAMRDDLQAPTGITKDQEQKLRIKTRAPDICEPEKWRNIYKSIFPDLDDSEIPSPYQDMNTEEYEHLTRFRNFLCGRFPHEFERNTAPHVENLVVPELMPALRSSLREAARAAVETVYRAYVAETALVRPVPTSSQTSSLSPEKHPQVDGITRPSDMPTTNFQNLALTFASTATPPVGADDFSFQQALGNPANVQDPNARAIPKADWFDGWVEASALESQSQLQMELSLIPMYPNPNLSEQDDFYGGSWQPPETEDT